MIQKRYFSFMKIIIFIGLMAITSAIVLPTIASTCIASPKTKIAAQVRQIAMAVENYYSDFQEFPTFEGLNKENARENTYYSGLRETYDGEKLHINFDHNLDGAISFEGKDVKAKVIVWTTYEGETIRSWDK